MGCGASAQNPEPARQLVLLGGGECGKTTIFKQIQILHGTGFADSAPQWLPAIRRSPVRSMKVLLMRLVELKEQQYKAGFEALEAEDKARMESVEAAVAGTMSDTTLTPALAADIAALWKHPLIRECLQHSDDGTTNRLDLDDNAIFFLDRVEKMADPSFKPANEEILKVRDPTRTIETLDFQANKAKFRVIDVGGQRMERPKWNLTGEITAVIFVCSLIEYNQVLREDVKQNRLKESLNLFDIACNRRYPEKPIILFLNKIDLFTEQVQKVDLSVCFPTYKGGKDPAAALEFIKWKFQSICKDKNKKIFIKETTATDPENMAHILNSVYEIVLRENLAQSGFS